MDLGAAQGELLKEPLSSSNIGAVVIGRNEGKNIERCLGSLGECGLIVYVDSGSTDDSVAIAGSMGAQVVPLDVTIPFTAARARNAGFNMLCSLHPEIEYVQFIDGDCEIISGWTSPAIKFLDDNANVAAVCGQRMERYPDASIYNNMCDREWDTPIGEADACGGDAIMRASALLSVGGFADDQIAHEEPELCGRLRKANWKIWRLDQPMTMHDAAIFRAAQFYNRGRRAGFGLAQCLITPDREIDRGGLAIIRRALMWTILFPIIILTLALAVTPFFAIAFLIYPAQIVRHMLNDQQRIGGGLPRRLQAASLTMLGKFAETQGFLEFIVKRMRRMNMTSIYYK